jgi:hypothetical protein
MTQVVPLKMSAPVALSHIRELAQSTANIVVLRHAVERQEERNVSRRQIELCIQTGYISEGPFLNDHKNWQVTMCGYHAGEELTCVVAIEWASKLLIITVY